MKTLLVAALTCATIALTAAACGSSSSTPTPVPAQFTAAPHAAPTTSPPASLSSVSPLASRVAEAVARRDEAALRASLTTSMLPCVATDSGQAGPFCRGTDPPGTVSEAFPTAVCEGGWTTDVGSLVAAIVNTAGSPYALAVLEPPTADWPADTPYGQTVLVFSPSGSNVTAAVALFLDATSVVRTQVGCTRADAFLRDSRGQSLRILWQAQ